MKFHLRLDNAGNWQGYHGPQRVMEFIDTAEGPQQLHAEKWLLEKNMALVAKRLEIIAQAAKMGYPKYHHNTWKQKN
jgi:hypothetical protein